MQQHYALIIFLVQPLADDFICLYKIILVKKTQIQLRSFDLHCFQLQVTPRLHDQVDLQWLTFLSFFELNKHLHYFLNQVRAFAVMQDITPIIVQLQYAVLIHYYDSIIKLKPFLFRLIPFSLMYILYVLSKLFPDCLKCFFRINMRDKMNTGQHIETIEVKYFYIQEIISENIVRVDHFLAK